MLNSKGPHLVLGLGTRALALGLARVDRIVDEFCFIPVACVDRQPLSRLSQNLLRPARTAQGIKTLKDTLRHQGPEKEEKGRP